MGAQAPPWLWGGPRIMPKFAVLLTCPSGVVHVKCPNLRFAPLWASTGYAPVRVVLFPGQFFSARSQMIWYVQERVQVKQQRPGKGWMTFCSVGKLFTCCALRAFILSSLFLYSGSV